LTCHDCKWFVERGRFHFRFVGSGKQVCCKIPVQRLRKALGLYFCPECWTAVTATRLVGRCSNPSYDWEPDWPSDPDAFITNAETETCSLHEKRHEG